MTGTGRAWVKALLGPAIAVSSAAVEQPRAIAQPAVDRLEDQVRRRIADDPKKGQADADGASTEAPFEPGYLGVFADDRADRGLGVRLIEVFPRGPAGKAGLLPGDLVIKVDARPVRSMDAFIDILSQAGAGTEIELEVMREGEETPLAVAVVLVPRPAANERPIPEFGRIGDDLPPPSERSERLGALLAAVDRQAQEILSLPQPRGAIIVELLPNSPLSRARISVESVIIAIDGRRIGGPEDVNEALDAAAGPRVKVAFYSDGRLYERLVALAAAAPADEPGDAHETPPQGLAERLRLLEERVADLERIVERQRELLESRQPPAEPAEREAPSTAE